MLYFDFWIISVHGRFDDLSHFVRVNINILKTHYVWAACVTSGIKLGTCEIRRLNWVMVTVSSITINTCRYADTYGIFYISVNFAVNFTTLCY